MSHTDHARLRALVAHIRAVEEDVGRPIGILADLQGPKLRVGKFADGEVELTPGRPSARSKPAPGDANARRICRIPKFSPRWSPAIAC